MRPGRYLENPPLKHGLMPRATRGGSAGPFIDEPSHLKHSPPQANTTSISLNFQVHRATNSAIRESRKNESHFTE